MIKHLANSLLAAIMRQPRESKPQQIPKEFGPHMPPAKSDSFDQAHREIAANLTAGSAAVRWLELTDGTPILLQLHQAPGSCELHPFHLHHGVAYRLGWLAATVRQTDETGFPTELRTIDHCYLYIDDFILTNRGNGLGSHMLQILAEVGRTVTPVCRIEGAISPVDWGHVERLERFYSRHGYRVELSPSTRSGRIVKRL